MCARHNGGDNNVDDKTASPYGRDDSFPTAVVVVIIVLTLLTLTRIVFVVVLLHMFLGQSRCHCTLAASVPLCGSAKLYCTALRYTNSQPSRLNSVGVCVPSRLLAQSD